jgi:hypothetical protein
VEDFEGRGAREIPGQVTDVEESQEGLTAGSLLAVLYAMAVLTPAAIYLQMAIGLGFAASAVYITALLFTEFGRAVGRPMKKQEVFVLYKAIESVMPIAATFFLALPFRSYIVSSPVLASFRVAGGALPLVDALPQWYVPSPASHVHALRVLISSEWIAPVVVMLITVAISAVMQVSLGILSAMIYVETEKLPFPMATVSASVITTLSERGKDETPLFAIAASIGLIYGLLAYAIPLISSSVFGIPITTIPIPWIDLNTFFERFLPGSSIGISTDAFVFVFGFMVPPTITFSMFVGSLAVWVVGSNIALRFVPEWAAAWRPTSSISYNMVWATIYVWVYPFIGMAIAASVIFLFKERASIVRAVRALSSLSRTERADYPSLTLTLGSFVGSVLLFGGLFYLLVGDTLMTVAAVLALIAWNFLTMLINGRATGEAGYSFSAPYVQQALWTAFKAPIGAWLVAAPFDAGGVGGYWSHHVKTAHLTQTKPMSFFKSYLVALVFAVVFGFLYTQLFWSVAPMPSSTYPYLLIQWPRDAMTQALWMTGQLLTQKIGLVGLGAAATLAIQVAISIFSLPLSLVGLLAGASQAFPMALTTVMGSFVGHVILRRVFKEKWSTTRATVVAGVAVGEGVAVGIGALVSMIVKSMWALPY